MDTFVSLISQIEMTSGLGIAYVAILIMALVPIYIGSHLSMKQKGMETMSTEDAWKFPFMGSAVLFGLYLLFKVFSKDLINMLLTGYFLCFGILAVSATLRPIFEPFFGKSTKKWEWSFPAFWNSSAPPFNFKFDKIDVVTCFFATIVGIWYVFTKHWISNNIMGLAFSIQGIALLSLGSYKIGCILLSGLFIYDIFWVFGTDVMVTVAKSFDAPVKLLFPKDLLASELHFSMLGLGDIVIPGIFIALLLRFDAKQAAIKKKKTYSKVYFYTCYLGYIVGLASTIIIMHTFQAAQPALLYLVPACIGTSFMVALFRGELGQLLAYSEENENANAKQVKSEALQSQKDAKKIQ